MTASIGVGYPRVWDVFARQATYLFGMLSLFEVLFILGAIFFPGGSIFWVFVIAILGALGFISTLFTWRMEVFGSRGSGRHRVGFGHVIGESRVARILYVSCVLSAIPCFVLIVTREQLFLDADAGSSRLQVLSRAAVFVAPGVLVGLIVISLCYIVGRLLVRGARIGIGMDASGVYHWWWAGCSFFPWEEITNIALMPPGAGSRVRIVADRYDYPPNPRETRIGRHPSVRRWSRKLNLGGLRAHPGLVYQALFFYLRNPDLREELGDERSVERMRRRDYGKIPLEIDMHGRALSAQEIATQK